MIPHLFDLFVQSNRVEGRVAEGLGLGLALVKSLAELYGGSVAAASDGPGRGSEFIVRLPCLTGRRLELQPNQTRRRRPEAPASD